MKLISELLGEASEMPLVEISGEATKERYKLTLAGLAYCMQNLVHGGFISLDMMPGPTGNDADEYLTRFADKMKVMQMEINSAVNEYLGVAKGLQQKGEMPKDMETDITLMVMFKIHNEQITKKEAN